MEHFSDICYVCKKKSENFIVHNKCKNNIYYDNLIILTHYKNNHISKLIKDLKFYNKKDILEDF
jgi:predicted amidophosphoribosyltransferase